MTPTDKWCAEVRELMAAKKLSGRALAKAAGVKHSSLRHVLSGKGRLLHDMAVNVLEVARAAEPGQRSLAAMPKCERVGLRRSELTSTQAYRAEMILLSVQRNTGRDLFDLRDRGHALAHQRWATAWLLRHVARLSFYQIGRLLGQTVASAQNAHKAALDNPDARELIVHIIDDELDAKQAQREAA